MGETSLTSLEKCTIVIRAFENAEWKVNTDVLPEELIKAAANDEHISPERISKQELLYMCKNLCNRQKEYFAYSQSLIEKRLGIIGTKLEMSNLFEKIKETYGIDD